MGHDVTLVLFCLSVGLKKPNSLLLPDSPVSVDPGFAVECKWESCNGNESYSGETDGDATNNSGLSVLGIGGLNLHNVAAAVQDCVDGSSENLLKLNN